MRLHAIFALAGGMLAGGCLPAQAQLTFPVSAYDDETGFVPIFDGKTLSGWEGDPTYWRVENGALVGEVTPATILKRNSFIIWRGGVTKDFDLKMEYRISDRGNSGVNYRSAETGDVKWAMRGYQADIEGQDQWTGQVYEERGRQILGKRGDIVRIDPGRKPGIIGTLGDAKELQSFVKKGDWNEYHLIGRGGVLIHILNKHVMSIVIDDDAPNRRTEGQLGVQVHVGPPMKIEYRNIRVKSVN
jgi:hypothetical protein